MEKRFLRKYDGKKQMRIHNIIEFLVIFFVVFIIFHFIIGVSFVKGNSMFPTLHNNELAFYTCIIPHLGQGDIVAVRMPSGEYYVKRVVAVEGDTVDIKEGNLYVNGKLKDESYVNGETREKAGGVQYPYTVDEGKAFVLGDNREDSMDSRKFGPVARGQIKGKLWMHAGKVDGKFTVKGLW